MHYELRYGLKDKPTETTRHETAQAVAVELVSARGEVIPIRLWAVEDGAVRLLTPEEQRQVEAEVDRIETEMHDKAEARAELLSGGSAGTFEVSEDGLEWTHRQGPSLN